MDIIYKLLTFSGLLVLSILLAAMLAAAVALLPDWLEKKRYRFKARNNTFSEYLDDEFGFDAMRDGLINWRFLLDVDLRNQNRSYINKTTESIGWDLEAYYVQRYSLSEEVFDRVTEMVENPDAFERMAYYYGAP